MGIGELFMLAVGLSMDAFAVSVCKGLAVQKARLKECAICGVWFGGFQALMPVVGYLLGTLFAQAIRAFDHWVAFGLLAVIGINMLKEAFSKDCDCNENSADFSAKTMFVMAVATSIDALAAGITVVTKQGDIVLAAVLIGVMTFLLSGLGVKIGNLFGNRFEKKAQIAGGVILILLGVKILLEDTILLQ